MVDPVSGGNTPRLQNITKTVQELEDNTRAQERRESRESRDVVEISDEAISLQQAESAAQETRRLVEENDRSITRDPNALNIFS